MKINKLVLFALLGVLVLNSCSNDDEVLEPLPEGDYTDGFFVLNEGYAAVIKVLTLIYPVFVYTAIDANHQVKRKLMLLALSGEIPKYKTCKGIFVTGTCIHTV